MADPTALDILKAARAKIADPKDWGKGARSCGRPCNTCCAAEALDESVYSGGSVPYAPMIGPHEQASRALHNAAGIENKWGALTNWNDAPERTHTEVMAAFNLAIATLRLS